METKEVKLKDICCKVVSGGTPLTSNKDYYFPETVPWLKTGEVNYRNIYETENFISEEGLKKSSAKLIPINSVIVAMYGQGDTAGRVAVNKIPLCTNQACCNLIINENLAHYGFIFYYLWTQYQQLVLYKTGGAQPNLNIEKIKNLKIKLPPLSVQQKIANILSRYDEAIENNSKRVKLLEQMAQNLYKEWFVRFRFPGWQNAEFENGMPKGWKVDKLGNLFKRLPFGKTYKKEDLEENGKIIVIDQSTDDYLGFHNEEPSHKASFDSPLILFGDHSCKFVLMTKNFSLGENIIPISSCNINPYYLFRAIDGIIETTEYKRHWSMLITQKILIPTDSLQTRFSKIYKSFIKQIENLKSANQNLAKQRDLLLPRLMSGKLEV